VARQQHCQGVSPGLLTRAYHYRFVESRCRVIPCFTVPQQCPGRRRTETRPRTRMQQQCDGADRIQFVGFRHITTHAGLFFDARAHAALRSHQLRLRRCLQHAAASLPVAPPCGMQLKCATEYGPTLIIEKHCLGRCTRFTGQSLSIWRFCALPYAYRLVIGQGGSEKVGPGRVDVQLTPEKRRRTIGSRFGHATPSHG
jgi:hypothetical protein